MVNKICYFALLVAICVTLIAAAAYGADGSASIKMGYTFVSDTGSVGVNQETYNVYEGFGLSINNLRYAFANGVTFGANLNNTTLKNRDLRAVLGKPGRFNISVTNSQYRRNYTYADAASTRRQQTGIQASFQPSRFFKFFGGYNLTDKLGETATILSHTLDTVITSTDYRQTGYNVGAQVGDRYGVIRFDYRHSQFDDRLTSDADRKSDRFAVSTSSSIPGMKRVFVAGGYAFRKDTSLAWESSLRTNQIWGAMKLGLNDGYSAEYRFTYDMTKHVGFLRETDNITHTFAVGKNWGRLGGIQGAYEQRNSDDFVNKTTSNGVIGNVWYRPTQNWSLSARFTLRDKSVSEGATLTGTESSNSNRFTAVYTDTAWGHIGIKWQSRTRTSDDLNSKVDYVSVMPDLSLDTRKFGRLEISYSYMTGTYENMGNFDGYKFLDHLVTGTVYLPTWHNLSLDFGGTYYLSQRDQDLEKTRLNLGGRYTILREYHLEARYNVFNYDNFLLHKSYYTGNIVEINIIKDVSF